MNAGKTTTLLQSAYNYRERGMKTLLFTPIIDDRYESGSVTSRIGLKSDAISFDKNFNFYKYVEEQLKKEENVKCILIDEAQFLSKEQVLQLSDVADFLKLPVLTYGLRSDFLGEPFEGSKYLLTLAEELNEIKTICHCGRKATMNARIDDKGTILRKGEQVEIGGNEKYISLCHRHFKQGITETKKT
jgi:thymidine kinase